MAYVTSAERFGRKIGVEEGLKKGLKEGREDGEIQKAQKVALKMLREGFDRDTICRLTELSISELEGFANEQVEALASEQN